MRSRANIPTALPAALPRCADAFAPRSWALQIGFPKPLTQGFNLQEIISHDMGKDGRGLEFQDRAEPAGSVAVVGGGGPGAAEIDGREERAEKALLLHAPVRVGEEGRGGNVGSDGEDSDSDSLHEQLGLARHRKPSNAEAQVESRAFQNRPMLDRSCRPSETQAVEDDIAYHRGILLKPGPSNVRAGDEEVPEVLAVNRKAHTRRMAVGASWLCLFPLSFFTPPSLSNS